MGSKTFSMCSNLDKREPATESPPVAGICSGGYVASPDAGNSRNPEVLPPVTRFGIAAHAAYSEVFSRVDQTKIPQAFVLPPAAGQTQGAHVANSEASNYLQSLLAAYFSMGAHAAYCEISCPAVHTTNMYR